MSAAVAIHPSNVSLQSLKSIRSLQLAETDGQGRLTDDLTEQARWSIQPADLARLEPGPVLIPLQSGKGEIIARLSNGKEFRTPLQIEIKNQNQQWSFENHIQPVLTKLGCNSGPCHGSAAGKNGFRLSLRGYAPEMDYAALTRQAGGRRLTPGHPEQSLMLWKATGVVPHGGEARVAPDTRDYNILSDWIAAGAKGMTPDTPTPVRLEVLPGSVIFQKGKSGRILVDCIYSDGTREDVTAWAKFGTTDETILKVSDSGRFTAENPGEAFVTVWFSSMVATTTVSVPSGLIIPDSIFANASRRNQIDELNLAKLKSLQIPPSPDAGDAAWLRRVTLDLTGTLPDLETSTAFLSDSSSDKRARMVDRLISSSEFIDYWAYQLSDLLLVSSNKLTTPAMWSFYNFVRSGVAENRPWNVFASQIITSTGTTFENGAGNYFVLHRDPTDLTETTTVAFLGLSLTCAKCHNHPLEKWTQDQYYGFASLLSRVGLKDGQATGETIVSDRPDGEILHPRKARAMPPQPLDASAMKPDSPQTRREALAKWMTSPDNPLFAKAIINRIWKKFLGRGLMDPEDDLRATNPPSDSALLAWLEDDFVKNGYDLRRLMKTISLSATYARSGKPLPENASDLRFLSHAIPRRLPAEVLLDVYSQTTGVPSAFPGFPEKWRAIQLPDTKVANNFLASFGRPERLATCSCERSNEPSVAQALHLANGETLNSKLKAEKSLPHQFADSNLPASELIRKLFLLTLTREPTPKELKSFLGSIDRVKNGTEKSETVKADTKSAELRGLWEDLFWAILTS
ncbi:MAG: DUF1553 domain-containing protein, partial [bacterium]